MLIPPSVLPDISPSRGRSAALPVSPISNLAEDSRRATTANLPLEGEMSGRTEGGATERQA
ncbi:hypothetical protein EJ071_05990 [Mesorhizobium sp. M1B.F.Ca.ET.045.04.1.1]|nr:hypothetical protein EJ071_05990 [Mesorhizobium sp. M1B.F.Ca.ET.045.04.1.1]